uniref:Uncharacterized protein n=1 Tax=Catharus ustulatus TaxID=91951 RepID=A0A8C3UMZ7_CATUS
MQGPGSPGSPWLPLGPFLPGAPIFPGFPFNPLGPRGPALPRSPVFPFGPGLPGFPVLPWGPGRKMILSVFLITFEGKSCSSRGKGVRALQQGFHFRGSCCGVRIPMKSHRGLDICPV